MPPRVPLGPAPAWLDATSRAQPIVPRLMAAMASVVGAYLVFSSLSFWLTNGAVDRARTYIADAIIMAAPRAAAGADRTVVTSGGRAGTAPATATPGASVADTSTPTPASILEWSVRPIAAPATTAPNRGSSGRGQGVGVSAGSGTGGAGVYDPYAGASPLRRDDAAGTRPDDVAYAAFLAALRVEASGAGGRFACTLDVAATGRVDVARCTRLSGPMDAQAVAAALRNRALYPPSSDARRLRLDVVL